MKCVQARRMYYLTKRITFGILVIFLQRNSIILMDISSDFSIVNFWGWKYKMESFLNRTEIESLVNEKL